jgi:hypothetical protein
MSRLAHFAAALCFALSAGLAPAHPNHGDGPPVAKEDLPALGRRVMVSLVQSEQLASSCEFGNFLGGNHSGKIQ